VRVDDAIQNHETRLYNLKPTEAGRFTASINAWQSNINITHTIDTLLNHVGYCAEFGNSLSNHTSVINTHLPKKFDPSHPAF